MTFLQCENFAVLDSAAFERMEAGSLGRRSAARLEPEKLLGDAHAAEGQDAHLALAEALTHLNAHFGNVPGVSPALDWQTFVPLAPPSGSGVQLTPADRRTSCSPGSRSSPSTPRSKPGSRLAAK